MPARPAPILRAPILRALPVLAALASPAAAGTSSPPVAAPAVQPTAPRIFVPNYWDTRRRPDKPDLPAARVVRFVTDPDFPPFNFTSPDGSLSGFSIDLTRAACEVLKVACTVQARRFDLLQEALLEGRADGIVAGLRITPELRQRFRITHPYHRSPARFVSRIAAPGATTGAIPEPGPETIGGRRVAVVGASAHEAYLKAHFPAAALAPAADLAAALAALRRGEADYAFGDGVALSLWLNGTDSAGCCAFRGGPYLDTRYFGEGLALIVRKEDSELRRALDYALFVLAENGTYADLYLRYFPIGFY